MRTESGLLFLAKNKKLYEQSFQITLKDTTQSSKQRENKKIQHATGKYDAKPKI